MVGGKPSLSRFLSGIVDSFSNIDPDVRSFSELMDAGVPEDMPLDKKLGWFKAQERVIWNMLVEKQQQSGTSQATLDKLQAMWNTCKKNSRLLELEKNQLKVDIEQADRPKDDVPLKKEKGESKALHQEVTALLAGAPKKKQEKLTADYTQADYIDDRIEDVELYKGRILTFYRAHSSALSEKDKAALEYTYDTLVSELKALRLDEFHELLLMFLASVKAGPAADLTEDKKIEWMHDLLNVANDLLSNYAIAKEEQEALLRGEDREGRLNEKFLVYRDEDVIMLRGIKATLENSLGVAQKRQLQAEITQFEGDCRGELSSDISTRMQQIQNLYIRGNELLQHPLLEDAEEMRLLLLAHDVTKQFDADRQDFDAHFKHIVSSFITSVEPGLPKDLDIDAQIEWVKYQNFMADILLSQSVVRQSDDIRQIQTAQIALNEMFKSLMQKKYGKIEQHIAHEIEDLFERLDAMPSKPLTLTEQLAFIKLGVDKINELLEKSKLKTTDRARLEEKKVTLLMKGEALLPKVDVKEDSVSPSTVMDSSIHASDETSALSPKPPLLAEPIPMVTSFEVFQSKAGQNAMDVALAKRQQTDGQPSASTSLNRVQNKKTDDLCISVHLFREVLSMHQGDIPENIEDPKRVMFDSIKDRGKGTISKTGIEAVRSELLKSVKEELAKLMSPFKPELRKEKAADINVLAALEKDLDQIKFKLELPGTIQLLHVPPSSRTPNV